MVLGPLPKVALRDSRKRDPLRGTSDLHPMYRKRGLRCLRTSTGVCAQGRVVWPPGTGWECEIVCHLRIPSQRFSFPRRLQSVGGQSGCPGLSNNLFPIYTCLFHELLWPGEASQILPGQIPLTQVTCYHHYHGWGRKRVPDSPLYKNTTFCDKIL